MGFLKFTKVQKSQELVAQVVDNAPAVPLGTGGPTAPVESRTTTMRNATGLHKNRLDTEEKLQHVLVGPTHAANVPDEKPDAKKRKAKRQAVEQ